MPEEKGIIRYTFPKSEKLYSDKLIEKVFSSGRSFISYPIRVVFFSEDKQDETETNTSILVSVSKKKFKLAVKRNLLKRRIREAYRINKQLFKTNKQLHIAFIYLSNDVISFSEIEIAMQKAAYILSDKIDNK